MLGLFEKGLIIGILVSAPMGPVGILCVRRTLSKGRWYGFVSGLGAALSDVMYAFATSLFMGLVVSFVETYMQWIELFGTAVVGIFGIYLLSNNPVRNLKKNREIKNTYFQDFITAFLLTLSNALIVLLYIGLFAHFSFVLPAHSWWEITKGLIGITLGAVLWWFVITCLISGLQRWFNIRRIHLLNRMLGSIILLLVFAQICYSFFFQST
ncbi:MAG: LysE family transporter [Tannerella sp.]|jgi:threonine/homoserine/homoserine lactone efflux protein|nr:LysE family transporter [Tannerella sp.]